MADVTYHIVEHDGGWAYKLGDSFSETYPTYDSARDAAITVAKEQQRPDRTTWIQYEKSSGDWVTERADGSDRPNTTVEG